MGLPAAATDPADDLRAMLREVLTGQRALAREVAMMRAELAGASRQLAEADERALGDLLQVVAQGLGSRGRVFTASEALAAARDAGRPLELSAKALGKLLARCEGMPVAGLVVRRDGDVRGACVWRVSRV